MGRSSPPYRVAAPMARDNYGGPVNVRGQCPGAEPYKRE